ncbi:hypothetical protein JCM5296_002399 [Sporobolomyces johnsonii]
MATIIDADNYKARSLLSAGGVSNPTDEQVTAVASTLAFDREKQEAGLGGALGILAEKLGIFAEATTSGHETQATLAKVLESTQARKEDKERKEGKSKGPTLTDEGTAEEDDRVRKINANSIPHFLLERFEKHQFVPLQYLRPSLVHTTYKDDSNAMTKLAKKVESPLDEWDDLRFAGDFAEYLPSLYALLDVYKTLNTAKHPSSPDAAVKSIATYVADIVSRFAQTTQDDEKLDILLYDRAQRVNLAKSAASTMSFNIGRFSASAMDDAKRSRHEMFGRVNASLPNVYHHLPASSPYHPLFSISTQPPSHLSSSPTYPPNSQPRFSADSRGAHQSSSSSRYAPYGGERGWGGHGYGAGRGGGRHGGSFRPSLKCFGCGERGHEARACKDSRVKSFRAEKGSYWVNGLKYCFNNALHGCTTPGGDVSPPSLPVHTLPNRPSFAFNTAHTPSVLLHPLPLKPAFLSSPTGTAATTFAPDPPLPTPHPSLPIPTTPSARSLASSTTPIVSPINADAIERLLRRLPAGVQAQYSFLGQGFREGFRLEIDPGRALLPESRTLPPAQVKAAKVLAVRTLNNEYIQKEKSAGRISIAMSQEDVERITGPFQVSPFGIVERLDKEPRHVRNFSFPYPSNNLDYCSVNDRASSFSPFPSAYWCGPRQFAQLVLDIGPDAEGEVDDLSKAFRRIPIHPDDRRWTVIEDDDKFHIDYCLPMGYTLATDIFGRLMDFIRLAAGVVLAERLAAKGAQFVAFRSWVDDIVVIVRRGSLSPEGATAILDEFYNELGLPLAPEKRCSWSRTVQFLGLAWDLDHKIVSLPEKKRVRAIIKIKDLLVADWCVEKTVRALAGYLSHISFAIPRSRSHNQSLFRLLKRYSDNPYRHFPLPPDLDNDLRWWLARLGAVDPFAHDFAPDLPPPPHLSFSRSLSPPSATFPLILYSDASNVSIGIVVGHQQFSYPTTKGWRDDGTNIDVPEAVGLELALLFLFDEHPSLTDVLIRAVTDNKVVFDCWEAGRSRSVKVNEVVERLETLLDRHGCELQLAQAASAPYYPPSLAGSHAPLPSSINGTVSFPYASPSDLRANAAGHVYPSRFNPIAINSKQIPAAHRLFYNARPPAPFTLQPEDNAVSYPPFSLKLHAHTLASIPKEMAERIGYALKAYQEWCSMNAIPDDQRFPITTYRLRLFISPSLGIYKADTIKRRVACLKQYSALYMLEWKVDEQELKPIFAIFKAHQPHPHLRRRPLLAQHLVKLVAQVRTISNDFSDRFHVAMLVTTLVGFGGILRSGEFTASKAFPDAEEWSKKVKLASVKLAETGQLVFKLPWDKANAWEGRQVTVASFNFGTPALFRRHLVLSQLSPSDFPFSYLSSRGQHAGKTVAITKLSWKRWLNARLAEIDEAPLQGHSVRIGGATQMLLNGVEPEVVKVLGGWKSDAFLKYWRHVDALIRTGKIDGSLSRGRQMTFFPPLVPVRASNRRDCCKGMSFVRLWSSRATVAFGLVALVAARRPQEIREQLAPPLFTHNL